MIVRGEWRLERRIRRLPLVWWGILVLTFLPATAARTRAQPGGLPREAPLRVAPFGDYVGSETCRGCHARQHASWHASYHRSMTRVPAEEAIAAPFAGERLALEGITWVAYHQGNEFRVAGRADSLHFERRIVLTTGSHNYQLYWMEPAGGAGMVAFPLVYLVSEKLWIPRKSAFLSPPAENSAFEAGRWSLHCIKCHVTGGISEAPPDDTPRVSELGVSCEACHGPGKRHTRRQASILWRAWFRLSAHRDDAIVNPARLSTDRANDVCSQCHSVGVFTSLEEAARWRAHGSGFLPGDSLARNQTLLMGRYEENPPAVRQLLDAHCGVELRNFFWPDGMLRVTGREYQGVARSPCRMGGQLSCLSCHDMHPAPGDANTTAAWARGQMRGEARGNGACTQCHPKYKEARARAGHTHHRANSPGDQCLNCHMPHTSWGLLRAIRSHEVDSPDVTTTRATGRPNACNLCHLDRSLRWTAGHLQDWYGVPVPPPGPDEENLAAAMAFGLSGDATQRALVAWSLGWAPARQASGIRWMIPLLCTLLTDPYDAVRFAAQRSLGRYDEYRETTRSTVQGATRAEQVRMAETILADWRRLYVARAEPPGPGLLLQPDGRIDARLYAELMARRPAYDMYLFE